VAIGTLGSNCWRGRRRRGGEEPLLRLEEAALRPVGWEVLPVLRCAFLEYARQVRWTDMKKLGPVVAVETKFLSAQVNLDILD